MSSPVLVLDLLNVFCGVLYPRDLDWVCGGQHKQHAQFVTAVVKAFTDKVMETILSYTYMFSKATCFTE